MNISLSTSDGDHQGRPGAVNLGPFVGVYLGLDQWPIVYVAVFVPTRT